MTSLRLEFAGEKQFGPCDCCGQMTQRVWGYVYDLDVATAAYFVEWTPGHRELTAAFDFILGTWGEHATALDRQAVALEFRKLDSGPAFMVVDANSRSVAKSSLVSQALTRNEVIGTPLATEVFSICDLVYLDDPRLFELRS